MSPRSASICSISDCSHRPIFICVAPKRVPRSYPQTKKNEKHALPTAIGMTLINLADKYGNVSSSNEFKTVNWNSIVKHYCHHQRLARKCQFGLLPRRRWIRHTRDTEHSDAQHNEHNFSHVTFKKIHLYYIIIQSEMFENELHGIKFDLNWRLIRRDETGKARNTRKRYHQFFFILLSSLISIPNEVMSRDLIELETWRQWGWNISQNFTNVQWFWTKKKRYFFSTKFGRIYYWRWNFLSSCVE